MADGSIRVEVAYAMPERQHLVELEVAAGTTAGEAVRWSGLLAEYPGLDAADIGVFGEPVAASHVLEDGDRVEIYRPLEADPRDVRRERARRGRATSRRG